MRINELNKMLSDPESEEQIHAARSASFSQNTQFPTNWTLYFQFASNDTGTGVLAV